MDEVRSVEVSFQELSANRIYRGARLPFGRRLGHLGLSWAFGLGTLVLTLLAFVGVARSEPLPAPAAPASATQGIITRTWENLGVYGAVVSAIAIDPNTNPPTGTVYAGTTSGRGLYRSTDGGLTWEGIYTASVQALAVNTTGRIVWAVSERGVITSADGGTTWHNVPYPPGIFGWARLVVSGSLTVLGAGETVARSRDGGATWDTTTLPCHGCQVTALAVDKINGRLFAATDNEVYVSPIAPLNFITSSGGVTSSHKMQNITALGVSPHISGVVYAGTGDTGQQALYRSDDGGVSWTQLYSNVAGVGYIVFHPVLTQTVYAGGMRSDDGLTFSPLGFGAGNSHLAIYPTAPYTMFGAIDQGINRSTDGGNTFFPVNTGIDGVVVQDFTQNPRDLGLYFVNTKSGIGRSFNGGQQWEFPLGYVPGTPSQPVGSHFGGAALAPYYEAANTRKVFLGELFSDDYGDTTQNLGNPSLRSRIESSGCSGQCAAFINTIAVDPADGNRVYAAVGAHHIPPGGGQEQPYGGLWESTDGGTTWNQHTTDYSASYGTLPYTTPARVVVFATGGLAYAGLGDFRNHTDFGGGMFGGVVSRTSTGSWQLLATITNPITASVEGLAVDPNDPQHIWVGTGGPNPRLYHSTDGGLSWEDRTPPGGDGAFQAIAVHPALRNIIFAASRTRVFYSKDGGLHWVQLTSPPAAAAEPIQRILLPILPPAPVSNLTGTVTGGQVVLSWTNPTGPRFQGVHIRHSTTAPPRTSVEGNAVVTLTAASTSYTASLSGGVDYFTVFPYDSAGRYGIGARLVVSGGTVMLPKAEGAGQVALLNTAEVRRAAAEADTAYLFVGTDHGLYRTEVGDLATAYQTFLPLVLRNYP